jgi:hypothetical protein
MCKNIVGSLFVSKLFEFLDINSFDLWYLGVCFDKYITITIINEKPN